MIETAITAIMVVIAVFVVSITGFCVYSRTKNSGFKCRL